MNPLNGEAVITGVGQSEVGRRLGRSGYDLTIEACLRAMHDAGVDPDDVDGVATYPGARAPVPGMTGAGAMQLHDALGLKTRWHMGTSETAGQLGPVMSACLAVATGAANHVVCFRSVWESTAQHGGDRASALSRGPSHATGVFEWFGPYGAMSAATWVGMLASRYMHDHGLTREQLAQVALTCRRHAAMNPAAIYRDPMTLDDYLASRMISSPLCLYDCDVPTDGAVAVVVSRRASSDGLSRPPITVEAFGHGVAERHTWDQRPDLTTMGAHDAASSMWEQTMLGPSDVDVMELYDGFSYIALQWIEALGFCEKGAAGRYVEGGHRIGLEGERPLNTQGGQLSAGRLHGLGFLHEACLQLWGGAGERQVVPNPAVAVAAAGGGPIAGCVLVRIG